MELKNLFYKDIDRDIKGVIKIGQDDNENVEQELEEYVVTREVSKHFSTFFESYKKGINAYTDKMGVWISGFFGSGKSHFLKILSYLLENKEVQGKRAISYFDDKIEDAMVLADMKKAGDVSTDVILFNIDSKADSDSKSNKDAIVKVFMKVFNEMQGYCSALPWVADLERQLVKEGRYEEFRSKFEELSGSKWEDKRDDFYFEEDNIVKALAETSNMSEEGARNWFNRAEDNYSLSIEKFANLVKEYIESKGSNHHVIFLVDEMGQYIGEDVGLMLNLQTVVEDLGTYCGGRAWVIVTSQQDIDSITKVKGNDFSKIQGRFNTRLSLTSANVDEVIKKRILRKDDVAKETLRLLYQDKESIIKNLITFSADTAEMKIYKSEEDFIDVYPFIPYQFHLLQSVFTGIRIHGASGKHLSEGERSLLSAFQESAIRYMNSELGTLIPFSAFYETVEAFLDSNISTVIIRAENNDRLTEDDVEVLKVLFLIKYVKEIPSNIENLATLMVNHIDDDKIDRKKEIEESLKRLIKETLIQKNGNEYIFLTNEEQDVNNEIKNIPIDIGEIILKVGEEIFTGIYSENRYRYNVRYHFDFNKIIDTRYVSSQRHDIGLQIITPYYDIGEELSEQELKMMSARDNNVIVRLPADTTFLDEMEEILKIRTYLRQKGGANATSVIEEIKIRKSREVSDREERVRSLLIEALRNADIYANLQKLDIKTKNPVERINEGFKFLIEGIYNKLNYIDTFIESNKDLNDILIDNRQITLTERVIPNKLALDEIDGYIERNTQRNIPMTIKTILHQYGKAPYGWRNLDVIGLLLYLLKVQEIRLQLGNESLNISDRDLINQLTKRDYQDRIIVKKREKISAKFINNVKGLAKDVFGVSALSSDEDGLMDQFKRLCERELNKRDIDTKDYGIYFLLEEYKKNMNYPGKDVLEKGQELFENILKIKDGKEFYERVYELQDDLLDYEEDVYDVKRFFKNQRDQFDRASRKLEIYENNKTYVVDAETIKVIEEIRRIVKSDKPYSEIHRLPSLVKDFEDRFLILLEKECEPIRTVIESDRKKVLDELALYEFKDELESEFQARFDDLLDRIDRANNFYEAIAMRVESDRIKIRSFDEIEKEKERRKPQTREDVPSLVNEDGVKLIPESIKEKRVKNISFNNMLHGAKVIETEEDIEDFLQEIRKMLKGELDEDTKIKLI